MTGPAARAGGAPGVRRVAWLHCFAGVAGDMVLGGLLAAGADLAEVTAIVRRLPVTGWELEVETVARGGLSAVRATVVVRQDDTSSRRAGEIVETVRGAALPARVEDRSLRVLRLLAEVEGRLHGRPPEDVHLHEVGGHDTIVEVVGAAAALEVLGVDDVTSSAVAVGTGTIETSHGTLPNPPPAVLRLLEGVPTLGRPIGVELTTPTGAALVRGLSAAFGPIPPMTVRASGYGAGSAELDHLPNATQVVLGEARLPESGAGQAVAVLEANLDDASGEQLAHAMRELLGAGALDAWVTPIVMKKGRPGHTLHVLADPAAAEDLAAVVRSTTGTFGVRAAPRERWIEARHVAEVSVTGQAVRMKVAAGRAKPEHDDVERAARATGLTTREVASRAEEAWRRR